MRLDSYCNYLNGGGIPCMLLSGDLAQSERSEVFESYRIFSVRTIVATDLIARGHAASCQAGDQFGSAQRSCHIFASDGACRSLRVKGHCHHIHLIAEAERKL
ncbi:uncharacterized protein DMAD_11053 [Drosophila madeirensis]|uniref:Helicase C-terminal domain-containing protein n=1 Tax=Drosophila madeirensis TaxID=30013 RepID=A0AAU9FBS7_DROMD